MVPAAPTIPALTYKGAAPRILVIRTSALGDLVFATSLLAGLRNAWPQAWIGWLAQPGFGSILEGDPRLDALIGAPSQALKSPSALWRLRRQLADLHIDWVLDAQGLARTRVLAALVPGAIRIGFSSKEPLGFLLDRIIPKGGDILDIASEYRYMAYSLTGQSAPPPRLVVDDIARHAAVQALAERGLAPGFIALCPFTTRPQKHWVDDYWGELAVRLDRPVAMFGGPADVAYAERLCRSSPVPILNLAGQTRLNQVASWLSLAGGVIGVDTGLTHIGIAVGRPVVALFGSTCPYRQGAASPLTVIYDALPCAPCRRNPTCNGRFDCMRAITPQRVAAAAKQLLADA